jgi:hypothetical protein
MRLKVTRVDLKKSRDTWPTGVPFAPAHIEPRADSRNMLILSAPFVPGKPPQWAHAAADEYLRIPLFPYLLNAEADLAFAFMLQLGLSCAAHLPKQVTDFHVATGVPVEMIYDDANERVAHLEYWVGFGVSFE